MAKKKPTPRSSKTKKTAKSTTRKTPTRKAAAPKKAIAKKATRKKSTLKKSTGRTRSAQKPATGTKSSTGRTGKGTSSRTRKIGNAALESVASPAVPQVSNAQSTTRPTRGKPARNRHSTLNAAARGERAAQVPEPAPAVITSPPERGGATGREAARRREAAPRREAARRREGGNRRDERMSTVAPPEPKMPKTRLNEKQLREFKDMLLAKRAELLSDVRMLTKDALGRSRKDSSGDLSSMPIHMADIGSDNWEQDFTLGLIANERQLVREIDEALLRVEERTYGVCLATHKPITVARLRAKPWAKFCIEYAQQLERRGY